MSRRHDIRLPSDVWCSGRLSGWEVCKKRLLLLPDTARVADQVWGSNPCIKTSGELQRRRRPTSSNSRQWLSSSSLLFLLFLLFSWRWKSLSDSNCCCTVSSLVDRVDFNKTVVNDLLGSSAFLSTTENGLWREDGTKACVNGGAAAASNTCRHRRAFNIFIFVFRFGLRFNFE